VPKAIDRQQRERRPAQIAEVRHPLAAKRAVDLLDALARVAAAERGEHQLRLR
jgi:hypothetical protein